MWMAHAAGHRSWTFSGTTAIIWLAKPVRLLAVWRQRARTRQDLLRLNDHYLRDIGLIPTGLATDSIVNSLFWRTA